LWQPPRGFDIFAIAVIACFRALKPCCAQGSVEQSNSSTGANSGSGSSVRPIGHNRQVENGDEILRVALIPLPASFPITDQPVGKDLQSEAPKR
jgi:hypothetical protein